LKLRFFLFHVFNNSFFAWLGIDSAQGFEPLNVLNGSNAGLPSAIIGPHPVHDLSPVRTHRQNAFDRPQFGEIVTLGVSNDVRRLFSFRDVAYRSEQHFAQGDDGFVAIA
jgi:hypothetical protein